MPTFSTDAAIRNAPPTPTEQVEEPAGNQPRAREPEITPALDAAAEFQPIQRQPTQAPLTETPIGNNLQIEEMQPPQPAQGAMTGMFAHRHPKLIKALAGVAAASVFIAAVVPHSVAYLASTPLRMFGSLLMTIAPKWGDKLFKNDLVKTLLGPVGKELSDMVEEAVALGPTNARLTGAAAFFLDVGSAGTVSLMSGSMKAYQHATKTYERTQFALGLNPVDSGARANRANPNVNQPEPEKIKPLHKVINHWFSILGNETPKTGLDEKVWKNYDKKFNSPESNAKSLSELLSKMLKGFPMDFREVNVPSIQAERQRNKQNLKKFINQRLLPVLLDIQNNTHVAETAFKHAGIGLGSCADLAVFGWMDVERGTKTAKYAEQYTELSKNSPGNTPEKEEILSNLVKSELQSFWLEEARNEADFQLQDDNRNPRTGGWQSRRSHFKTYHRLDHVECYLDLCNKVQKMCPNWFPSFPYMKYKSGFTKEEIVEAAKRMYLTLGKHAFDVNLTKVLKHFQSLDVWQKVLAQECPDVQNVKTTSLEHCAEAMSSLDDLKDLLGDGAGKEYTQASEAIGALYKKFNGDKLRGDDDELSLTDFVNRKIQQCEPFVAVANTGLNPKAEVPVQARKLQALLTAMTADSKIFSRALDNAIEALPVATAKPELDNERLEWHHGTLQSIQTNLRELENSGEPAANEIYDFSTLALKTQDQELLRAIVALPKLLDPGVEQEHVAVTRFRTSLDNITKLDKQAAKQIDDAYKKFTIRFLVRNEVELKGIAQPRINH